MITDFFQTSVIQTELGIGTILLCTCASLLLGIGVAALYMYRNQKYTKGFVVTLALLPAIVQIVIMLVNGNLGAGVAVAGTFSLVRFRSVPGNARDIGSIFFAMAIGLATGMGYLFYGLLFLVIIGAVNIILIVSRFGGSEMGAQTLKITIPETLDYENVFDDILLKYTDKFDLQRVRTTNMGSLFELCYLVDIKAAASTKAFLDEIRVKNGNLNIILTRQEISRDEL